MRARLTVVLASLALVTGSVLVTRPASASATSGGLHCPQVMFYGAHGMNEGDSGTTPDKAHWGGPVDQVYRSFLNSSHTETHGAESVDYPQVSVNFSLLFGSPGVNVSVLVLRLLNSTNSGAEKLKLALQHERTACPGTKILLAGYSQGAWVIDKALHSIVSDGSPESRQLLKQIKGVFLMGDPAWPQNAHTSEPVPSDEYGIASHVRGMGYNASSYYKNGLAKGAFDTVCIHDDPICVYDGNLFHLLANIHLHWGYAKTLFGGFGKATVAQMGGNFLADQAT